MVELMITLVFVSFSLVGIYAFFHPASVLSSNFSNHLVAMRLGQEGVEVIKNIRDNNIRSGRSWLPNLTICTNSRGCQLTYKTLTSGETDSDRLKLYDENAYLKVNGDGFYDYSAGGVSSIFKRKVFLTRMDSDLVRIEVTVSWNYNNKTITSQTVGYMYNY